MLADAAPPLTLWARTHAFSCKRSASRILRHNYINHVTWRSLTRAGVPSMKEPHGLVRDDGKRPDGLMLLLPWNSGRRATWDVTVVDTLGRAYLQQSAITGASAAETAAARKANKYSSLCRTHDFFSSGPVNSWPHECQCSGVPGASRKAEVTTDPRETAFLFQCLSVAVQRFNAAYLADAFPIYEYLGR